MRAAGYLSNACRHRVVLRVVRERERDWIGETAVP